MSFRPIVADVGLRSTKTKLIICCAITFLVIWHKVHTAPVWCIIWSAQSLGA